MKSAAFLQQCPLQLEKNALHQDAECTSVKMTCIFMMPDTHKFPQMYPNKGLKRTNRVDRLNKNPFIIGVVLCCRKSVQMLCVFLHIGTCSEMPCPGFMCCDVPYCAVPLCCGVLCYVVLCCVVVGRTDGQAAQHSNRLDAVCCTLSY